MFTILEHTNGSADLSDLAPSLDSDERLWLGVMITALRDLAGLAMGTHPPHGKANARADAAAWFESDSREEQSFFWVCAVLGLDPNTVRAFIAKPDFSKQVRRAGPLWGRLLFPRDNSKF